jgi:hypothetical protein
MWGTWGGVSPRCKVRRQLRQGAAIGYFHTGTRGTPLWVVVVWDNSDVPELRKAKDLMLKFERRWVSALKELG